MVFIDGLSVGLDDYSLLYAFQRLTKDTPSLYGLSASVIDYPRHYERAKTGEEWWSEQGFPLDYSVVYRFCKSVISAVWFRGPRVLEFGFACRDYQDPLYREVEKIFGLEILPEPRIRFSHGFHGDIEINHSPPLTSFRNLGPWRYFGQEWPGV